MSDIIFKNDLLYTIKSSFIEASKSINVNASLNKEDINIKSIPESNDLNIILNPSVYLYDSNPKYKELTELNYSDFYYDGEIFALRDIEKELRKKDIKYFEKGVNIEVKFEEQNPEDIYPLEKFLSNDKQKRKLKKHLDLKNNNTPNILNSEEAVGAFIELAETQRGEPEKAMLRCQHALGGGVMSVLLEHIGDLTHRMSEAPFVRSENLENSLSTVIPKVERGLRYIQSKYGIEKEHSENMKSNFKFFKDEGLSDSFEEWSKKINKKLEDYSLGHSKLKVYNKAQYAAREAAVSLGRLDFQECEKHLNYLKEIIEDETYTQVASLYDPNYEPKINKKNKLKNR